MVGAAPKMAQAPDGFRPIFLEHLSSRLCQPMTYQPTAVQLASGWSEDGQADRRSKEIVGGHTLRWLRRQRGEGFRYAVLDCARIQDGDDHTGTANIVMDVHTMLALIGSLIVRSAVAVILMLTANLPAMIVAMVMVAMMSMAMLGVRVCVDNEAGECTARRGH